MSEAERDECLRRLTVPIPGEPPDRTIELIEDPKDVHASGSTGTVIWPSAVGLIQHLDTTLPRPGSGTKAQADRPCVVELGAGTGAVGIFLAQHKGLQVVVTEVPNALPLLRRNLQIGTLGEAVVAAPLEWGNK